MRTAKPSRWMGVAIYFYAFVAIGIAEAGLGVLLPSILVAYGLTPATVTLLFVSQISGYITAALTSSVVTERLGLGRMLLLAASLLTGALLTYALSPMWGLMVAAGTLLGLGIGLIDAGINTALAQDDRAAHLLGALHGFYGIGAFSGPAIATTLLALGWNWRQVYGVLASLTGFLLVGVLVALAYRYPPLMKPPVSSASPAKNQIRQALQTPMVLLFGAFLFVYVGIEATFSHWAYSVQVIARSTPPLLAGYGVSAYWIGLTVGRFLMGYGLRRRGDSHPYAIFGAAAGGPGGLVAVAWVAQFAVDWPCPGGHVPHHYLAHSQAVARGDGASSGGVCHQCRQRRGCANSGGGGLGSQ